MAYGTGHIAHAPATGLGEASVAASRTRSNSAFIRELWTDEFIATYKTNLVMANLVHRMNFNGKKGDTVHVPRLGGARDSGAAKAVDTAITLQNTQATQTNYLIDTHWHYAVLIEDIVKVQGDDSLRAFYTDDAAHALARKVDSDLHDEGAKFAGSDASPTVEGSSYSKAVVGTPSAGALVTWDGTSSVNGASEGNASVLTDEGIRLLVKELDDNDVPNAGRVLVIPPVEKKNLLGIPRYTEQAFVGDGKSIRNGMIGSVYNTDIYVSTNCATVQDQGTNGNERACLYFQKDAIVLIEQMAPRLQSEYVLEYLGDAFVADTIFGTGVLRPEAGIAIVVPA